MNGSPPDGCDGVLGVVYPVGVSSRPGCRGESAPRTGSARATRRIAARADTMGDSTASVAMHLVRRLSAFSRRERGHAVSTERKCGAPSGVPLCLDAASGHSACGRSDGFRLSRGFRDHRASFTASCDGQPLHE